ncbi:MAG TPA: NAD-dependent epimerase/dehydratase family protein [Gaiellaceae bacterium]|nr:NAD-dependent epimerase/dehydratase family protein [Gaiellaceae bacterium]
MTKVLVTGGFGFIGSRIAETLLERGDDVVVLEHPATPVRELSHDVELVRADITDGASLGAVQVKGVDAVLHLAGQPSGARSFEIPVEDMTINAVGTLRVAQWCLANDVDRIVAASTFNVYGDHPELERYAEDTSCRPKSVYASSKLAAEHLLANWAGPKGVRWNALRMFNVYGPGQDITCTDQGVVGIFMGQLMKSDRIEVKGSLERFRDLVYIDDVVQAWVRCLDADAPNQALNLGTGEKTTFGQLIRTLAEVMGKADRLEIVELPGTPGDMLGCVADLTRIRAAIGYEPTVPLEQGLEQMYRWAA